MRQFVEARNYVAEVIDSPVVVKLKIPLDELTERSVAENRGTIASIVNGEDSRLLTVVAMRAARDIETVAALSQRLRAIQDEAKNLLIVLQVFCPACDMYLSRELLMESNSFGVPAGVKLYSPYLLTYTEDVFSWALVDESVLLDDEDGYRAYEGIAGGLAMPFAFEASQRNMGAVVRGIRAARSPGRFLGPDQSGRIAVHETSGNAYGHVVARCTAELVSRLSAEEVPCVARVDMPPSRGYAHAEARKQFERIASWRRTGRLRGVYLYSAVSAAVPTGSLDYLLRHLNHEMER